MNHKLPPNPYAELSADMISRLSADVSYRDKAIVHSCSGVRGMHKRIVELFYAQVAEDLRKLIQKHNIIDLDERHRILLEIVRRRTAPELANKITVSHDAGGVAGVNSKA